MEVEDNMYRVRLLGGVFLLTALSFGQNPDVTRNSKPDSYSRDTFNRPVKVIHTNECFGLLGLLGLAGLFGRTRRNTVVMTQDEYDAERRRRAAERKAWSS